jgi:hypothetical protein
MFPESFPFSRPTIMIVRARRAMGSTMGPTMTAAIDPIHQTVVKRQFPIPKN